jgi:HlyD family secretion protein
MWIFGGVGVLALAAVAWPRGSDAVAVRLEPVRRRDLVEIVTATGVVQPRRKVDIVADVSGRVAQVYVREGQWVNEGDLLLRIDPSTYEPAVRRARAAWQQADANARQAEAQQRQAEFAFRRAQQLAQRQLAPAAEVDNARTAWEVARAQAEAARAAVAQAQAAYLEAVEALRKTLLRAPMSGRIVRLEVEAGETAVMGTINTPGSRLLTIADPSALEVRARVDETDVPRIHIGDSANVELDALPGRTFAGRVVRIGESAVANERRGSPADAGAGGRSVDYEVVVELLERDPAVRPDMSAAVRIVTARRTGALAVPIVAVAVRDSSGRRPSERPDSARTAAREREGVFVVRGGVARFAPVTLGIAGEGYFEVLRGVREGDTIVAGPYDAVRTLESGRKVRPLSIGSP